MELPFLSRLSCLPGLPPPIRPLLGAMSEESVTVILPFNLGAAAKYDQHVFPLSVHDGPSSDVSKGIILLSATLEEMARIKELGIDLSRSHEFVFNTRVKYEALAAKKSKLLKKRRTLNPFKLFLNYRAARVFHAAALDLFLETKGTSERMQREHKPKSIQSVPTTEMRPINVPPPANANVGGIAIKIRGALDNDAIQTIRDAANTMVSHASDSFVNNTYISQLDNEGEEMLMSLADTDVESLLSLLNESVTAVDENNESPDASTISPSSPQTITINVNGPFYNHSILTTDSNATGLTINHGSSNVGASVSQ